MIYLIFGGLYLIAWFYVTIKAMTEEKRFSNEPFLYAEMDAKKFD